MISDNKSKKLIDNHLPCELNSPDHNSVAGEKGGNKIINLDNSAHNLIVMGSRFTYDRGCSC